MTPPGSLSGPQIHTDETDNADVDELEIKALFDKSLHPIEGGLKDESWGSKWPDRELKRRYYLRYHQNLRPSAVQTIITHAPKPSPIEVRPSS